MKRFIIIAISIITILIGAIILLNFNNKKEDNEVINVSKKAQIVEVYDCSTNELITKYEKQEDIDNLMKKLNIDEWNIGNPNSEDLGKYLIKMYQKPTKKVLQKDDSEMNEIGTIIIYKSGEYVDFNIGEMKLKFKTDTNLANIF